MEPSLTFGLSPSAQAAHFAGESMKEASIAGDVLRPCGDVEIELFEDLCEALFREDLGEGETATALLEELLSEELDLPRKTSVHCGSHDTGS